MDDNDKLEVLSSLINKLLEAHDCSLTGQIDHTVYLCDNATGNDIALN